MLLMERSTYQGTEVGVLIYLHRKTPFSQDSQLTNSFHSTSSFSQIDC